MPAAALEEVEPPDVPEAADHPVDAPPAVCDPVLPLLPGPAPAPLVMYF